jgi:multicomponent Na+:H+ antiporter subunit E
MAARITFFALLIGAWWVITEGGAGGVGGWSVAAAAALAGVYVRGRLAPAHAAPAGTARHRLSPMGLLAFVPYFLWQSLRGGTDVALRAMGPGLRLAPDLLDHPMALPPGPARTLFTGTLSLLPGTFSADLEGDTLRVHVLDRTGDVGTRIAELERRVAAVYRLPAIPARDVGAGGGHD